jgi:hypothetical protein
LAETIVGQHLALSVAAHLARTQLVAEPLAVHDAQHTARMLDVVAAALARVAPLYVQEPGSGTPRLLTEGELEGAAIKRGATLLVLRDGRTLSGISIKRADLRQAVAILKAVGIPELQGRPRQAEEPKPAEPAGNPLESLAEIEKLLRLPLAPSQVELANRLAVSIARSAPQGRVANLAMQLMSAVHEAASGKGADESRIGLALERLRAALQELEQ